MGAQLVIDCIKHIGNQPRDLRTEYHYGRFLIQMMGTSKELNAISKQIMVTLGTTKMIAMEPKIKVVENRSVLPNGVESAGALVFYVMSIINDEHPLLSDFKKYNCYRCGIFPWQGTIMINIKWSDWTERSQCIGQCLIECPFCGRHGGAEKIIENIDRDTKLAEVDCIVCGSHWRYEKIEECDCGGNCGDFDDFF